MNISGMNDALSSQLFLSLDLGTTSLAGRLVDRTGAVLAETSQANPQQRFGADILSRMQASHEGAAAELQELLREGARDLVAELLQQVDASPGQVTAVAAAGNPGMALLLQGLPVEPLLYPPHRPPSREPVLLTSAQLELGLDVPLLLFPAVSGFVGGDLVAFLYGLEDFEAGTICIDIGTNAELALWTGRQWLVSSAAAGPAFEAGNIGCGMTAQVGAVTDVVLQGDRLQLQVAGGGAPTGLCGSGLAALIGALVEGGLVDSAGRIVTSEEVENNLGRYLDSAGNICFYRDASKALRLTQADLRNFQLAKGALRAGLEVLQERAGFDDAQISKILVSGAFGKALPVEALKKVAILSADMVDKTFFVPNGVLAGLTRFLTTSEGGERLTELMALIKPFPLSGTPAFEEKFLAALDFTSK